MFGIDFKCNNEFAPPHMDSVREFLVLCAFRGHKTSRLVLNRSGLN